MFSKNFLVTSFIVCVTIKGLLRSYLPPLVPDNNNNNKQQQTKDDTLATTTVNFLKGSSSSQLITTTSSSDSSSTTTTTALDDNNNDNDNYGFSVTITDPPKPPMNPGNLVGIGEISNKLRKAMNENTAARDILLIHVGQSVGRSLFYRNNIAATTSASVSAADDDIAKIFPLEENRLAHQTRTIINHENLSSSHAVTLKKATSFLFPLRSPPDRIHDVYRFSHPANCRSDHDSAVMETYGCYASDATKGNLVGQPQEYYYKLWMECFPSPNMEMFAQELLPPYPQNNPRFIAKGFTIEKQNECRRLARTVVLGYTTSPKGGATRDNESTRIAAAPEMYYNYQYYQKHTLQKYSNTKELFVVRFESQYEYNDMVLLDAAMGGYGKFHNPPPTTSTPEATTTIAQTTPMDKYYMPSTLSPEATAKVCCVLADEIAAYWQIWDVALNHDSKERPTMSTAMRKQCSLTGGITWSSWMKSCREQVEKLQSAQ